MNPPVCNVCNKIQEAHKGEPCALRNAASCVPFSKNDPVDLWGGRLGQLSRAVAPCSSRVPVPWGGASGVGTEVPQVVPRPPMEFHTLRLRVVRGRLGRRSAAPGLALKRATPKQGTSVGQPAIFQNRPLTAPARARASARCHGLTALSNLP